MVVFERGKRGPLCRLHHFQGKKLWQKSYLKSKIQSLTTGCLRASYRDARPVATPAEAKTTDNKLRGKVPATGISDVDSSSVSDVPATCSASNQPPEQNYFDSLRNSSYAVLECRSSMTTLPKLRQPSADRYSSGRVSASSYGVAQSLPYISRSISVDSYTAERQAVKQTPSAKKQCELEEYARRYEALQRGSSYRRRKKKHQLQEQQQQQQKVWSTGSENSNPNRMGISNAEGGGAARRWKPGAHCDLSKANSSSDELQETNIVIGNGSTSNLNVYESNGSLFHADGAESGTIQRRSKKLSMSGGGGNSSSNSTDSLQPSKSVPNLSNGDENKCGGGGGNYSLLDPKKMLKVPDNTLKRIQKQALLDYYERHSTRVVAAVAAASATKDPQVDHDSGFYSPTQPNEEQSSSSSPPPPPKFNDNHLHHRSSVGDLHDAAKAPSRRRTSVSFLQFEAITDSSDQDFTTPPASQASLKSEVDSTRKESSEIIRCDDVVEDLLDDEEIESILEEKDSARPVFLQEVYAGSQQPQHKKNYVHPASDEWHQSDERAPERPPKKQNPQEGLSPPPPPPPETPPRGQTPSVPPSRPPSSRTSPSLASSNSRMGTPTGHLLRTASTSSIRCRPKFPSPPGSPKMPTGRRPTDQLPTPPHPDSQRPLLNGMRASEEGDDKPTLRIRDKELSNGGGGLLLSGREGKYRRTSSPIPSSNYSFQKRQSPATIAAKGAPGWEKFLGGKTSTVLFTSDEAEKIKKDQRRRSARPSQSQQMVAPPPPVQVSRPRTTANGLLETSFGNDRIGVVPAADCHEDVGGGGGGGGGNSKSPSRGLTTSGSHSVSHSHSNSDSGLSSLSGRTSTMSPISTMSIVSSASSSSSSGSSSRASLRSASIVSSCTIPLENNEEHENDATNVKSPSSNASNEMAGFTVAAEKLPEEIVLEAALSRWKRERRIKHAVLQPNARTMSDYLEGLFNCRVEPERLSISNADRTIEEAATSCSPSKSDREELKGIVVSSLSKLIKALADRQSSLRNETKTNEELGRQLTVTVMRLASPNECDKYKLHVEETDKITSLLLGLTGRLARTENLLEKLGDGSEKAETKKKLEKIADQLEEAKNLKKNIDRKSLTVAKILQKYLSQQQFEDYRKFITTKSKLIVETRLINDKVNLANEQLIVINGI